MFKRILLILAIICVMTMSAFAVTGTYTDNGYFYLPAYGSYGTTEFDEYNAYMQIADTQIEANKNRFVNCSDYAHPDDAITAIGATEATLLITEAETCDTNFTVPANVKVVFERGGEWAIANGVTVTFNGQLEAGLFPIFAYTGTGVLAGTPKVDTYYPQWWGATADGSTDDSAAIQDAIDMVENNGNLFFPKGTYVCESLNIVKPIVISGYGTLKKKTVSNDLIGITLASYSNHEKVVIKDITIDGNEQGAVSISDLVIVDVGDILIDNVTFWNPAKASVWAAEGANITDMKIINCNFFEGMESSGIAQATMTYHINVQSIGFNAIVDNCYFNTSITFVGNGTAEGVTTASPLSIVIDDTNSCIVTNNRLINAGHIDIYDGNERTIIANNYIEKCHHSSIKVQTTKSPIIESNQIYDQTCDWSSAIRVDCYERAATDGSLDAEQYYGTIKNNIIKTTVKMGIAVDGIEIEQAILDRNPALTQDDLLAKGFLIEGNVLKNIGENGISLYWVKDCTVKNNYIEEWGQTGTAGQTKAIAIQDFYGSQKVEDNTIIGEDTANTGIGIYAYQRGDAILDGSCVNVTNNYIYNTDTWSIYIKYSDEAFITKNTLKSAGATDLYVNSCDLVTVWDNYVNYTKVNVGGNTLVTYTPLSITSQATGDILYFNGTNWVRLAKGTAGQVLEMNAGATAPEWDVEKQPLEATLTDIADGTIDENLVNTAYPWADNEVSDTLTASVLVPAAEVDMGAHSVGFTQQTITYNVTTTTVDWTAGNKATVTLTGNVGTLAFTNPTNPCNVLLKIVQDATGSRVVTAWDADIKWAGGTAPTLTTTANGIDICSFYWDGTNYFGVASLAFATP